MMESRMPSLLKLLVTEDDAVPLLLGLAAVNGDMRLYSEYLAALCRDGAGGARRLACRYMEHLASVKEPLVALEKLGEEMGGSSLLKEITRSMKLGLEPSLVAERIVERVVARLQARASLVDDIAKAILEVLALTSTILAFTVVLSAVVAGSTAIASLLPYLLSVVAVAAAFVAPSIARLGAPRIPPVILLFSMLSLALSIYALYARSMVLALVAVAATAPIGWYTLVWWRENKSAAELAIRIAEAMQLGYIGLEGDTLAYDVFTSARHRLKSSLSILLSDMLRLLPQEGSVTAARLLRNFAEFATRYLELAKSALVKSIVYEAIVAVSMPALTVLASNIMRMMEVKSMAPFIHTVGVTGDAVILTLLNLPAIAYTLVTSKIGRGTPLLPLLHPLPALLTLLLSRL